MLTGRGSLGVLLGKLIRCTECWKDGGPNYNPSDSHAKHLQYDFKERGRTIRTLQKHTNWIYSKVLLGKLIRCTECWKTVDRITICQTVMQSTSSMISTRETIRQGCTKTHKLNIQQRYIWVADQESCCRQSKVYLVQEYRQKDEKCRCQSTRGNKSGPKDKAQRMGAPRPSLT